MSANPLLDRNDRRPGDGIAYEWFSKLDERVCLVCLAMDGVVLWLSGAEVAERAAGVDDTDFIRAGAHDNCRCMLGRVDSKAWSEAQIARRLMEHARKTRNPYRPEEAP